MPEVSAALSFEHDMYARTGRGKDSTPLEKTFADEQFGSFSRRHCAVWRFSDSMSMPVAVRVRHGPVTRASACDYQIKLRELGLSIC